MECTISIVQKDLEAQVPVRMSHTWAIKTFQFLRSTILLVGSLFTESWIEDETVDRTVPAKYWIVNEIKREEKPGRKLNVVDVENRLIEPRCHRNGRNARVWIEDEAPDRKVISIQRTNSVHTKREMTVAKRPELGQPKSVPNLPRVVRRVDNPAPDKRVEHRQRRPVKIYKVPTPHQVKLKKRRQAKGLRKKMSLQDSDLRQFAIKNAWRKSRLEGSH